ncbi:MAG: sigma 54-interacting transcriptional regulator [Candidatus Cloacimonetes bacterium]|nr:sigma 54-interacting transcriptional regulator [Candidatus Cloacimonadota bacterium]
MNINFEKSVISIKKNISKNIEEAEKEISIIYSNISKNDFDKLAIIQRLFSSIEIQKGNYKNALNFISLAEQFSNSSTNKTIIISVYFEKYTIFSRLNQLHNAFEILQKIKNLNKIVNDQKISAELNLKYGYLKSSLNDYDAAIQHYFEAYKIFSELNEQEKIAEVYNSIGLVFEKQKNLIEAEKYYLKSFEIIKKTPNLSLYSRVLNNLGVINFYQKSYEEALDHYNKSLVLKEKIKDRIGIANIYSNIGIIYTAKKDFKKAEELYEKALTIRKNINDKKGIGNSLLNIGLLKMKQAKTSESENFLNEAYLLAKEIDDFTLLTNVTKEISNLYAQKNEFKAAFEKYQLYSELYKRHLSQKNKLSIEKLITKYDIAQKEQENRIFQNKLHSEKKIKELKTQLAKLKKHNSLLTSEFTKKIQYNLVGSSPQLKTVLSFAQKVAKSRNTNVLITGESGTGKEIIARIIHYKSERKHESFFAINCAAINENLMESELFGHTKGAFTDAKFDKTGILEAANGGSIFFDEIGDLPLSLQAKLLRVLDQKTLRKLGSNREIKVDIRIISASNKNLNKLITTKEFRLDLYQRIASYEIYIPPLRNRKEDLEPLIYYYLEKFAKEMKKTIPFIKKDTLRILKSYDYPGNVRELKNIIERSLINCDKDELLFEHLNLDNISSLPDIKISMNLLENEKNTIRLALKKANFNQTKAAKILNISRQTLIRKMKKHNL